MAQKDEQLATESVGKLLLKLSIPTITAQLVNALYNMVDRMYIGHIEGIGANALTGIGLTMPIIMLISACAYLFCIGGAPRASIMMGRGKPEEAEKILGSCTLGTIVAAIILTVIFLLFGERFLWMFGGSENTLPYAMSHMQVSCLRNHIRSAGTGPECFHHGTGLYKDQYAERPDRCSM